MTDTNQYLRSAKRYKAYKYLTLAALLVFFFAGMVAFKDDLTAENFRYLLRYINSSSQMLDDSEQSINISAPADARACVFREDVAVLYGDTFSMYSFEDELLYTTNIYMTSPELLVSDKCVICYDIGGASLKVFNSFSLLWEKKFEHPIICADLNNNGVVCVVTGEDGVRSALYVYDSNGNMMYRWTSSSRFVTDASVSEGREPSIVVSCINAEAGDFVGEILTLKTGDSTEQDRKLINSAFPIFVDYNDNDTYSILSEDSVIVYDRKNDSLSSYAFEQGTLKMYRNFDEYIILSVNENKIGNESEIRVIDRACDLQYTLPISGRLLDIAYDGNKAYVLVMDTLHIIDIKEKSHKSLAISSDFNKIFISDHGRAVLLGEDRAIAVYIE